MNLDEAETRIIHLHPPDVQDEAAVNVVWLEYVRRRSRLHTIEAAVRALHRPVIDEAWPPPGHCLECQNIETGDYVPWPCPTARALAGET